MRAIDEGENAEEVVVELNRNRGDIQSDDKGVEPRDKVEDEGGLGLRRTRVTR